MTGKLFYVVSTLLAFILTFAVFIRFNPVDPGQYHGTFSFTTDQTLPGGYGARRAISGDPELAFATAAQIIARAPRTSPLAGDPNDLHVSFVTRSRLWGFPDVTNLWIDNGVLYLRGQQVFGGSDHGVNRKRIQAWMIQIDAAR